ncbi:MAG: hypothetical protein CVV59_00810 [Tenericutes bacterium HGW-Tenericutes-4]|nr:MAG: hypothetical protein CVV59_00810 [Tenericutes bacterium HGW-Tenericutes-4]
MKTISSRQFYALIFFVTVVGKFLYLPSILTAYSGSSAYFVVLFFVLIDAVFLMGVLYFIKNSQHSFFTNLKESVQKPLHKILLFLYTLYFFFKTLLLIVESSELFQVSFYSSFKHYEFFILLAFLILYAFSVSSRTLLRCLEFLKPFFIIGLLFVLLVGVMNANVLYSLPILENGLSKVLETASKSVIWFGDFLILFLFLNKVEVKKHFYKQSLIHFFTASLIVIIFVFCFYSTFNVISPQKTLAMCNLLQNMSGTSVFSKLDWLFVSFWSLGLLFNIILFSYATFAFFKKLFPKLQIKLSAIILVALLFLVLLYNNFQVSSFYPFIKNASYFILVLQYIIPILLFMLFYKSKTGGNYAKNKVEKQ